MNHTGDRTQCAKRDDKKYTKDEKSGTQAGNNEIDHGNFLLSYPGSGDCWVILSRSKYVAKPARKGHNRSGLYPLPHHLLSSILKIVIQECEKKGSGRLEMEKMVTLGCDCHTSIDSPR